LAVQGGQQGAKVQPGLVTESVIATIARALTLSMAAKKFARSGI
jgi:hypothetical protein